MAHSNNRNNYHVFWILLLYLQIESILLLSSKRDMKSERINRLKILLAERHKKLKPCLLIVFKYNFAATWE